MLFLFLYHLMFLLVYFVNLDHLKLSLPVFVAANKKEVCTLFVFLLICSCKASVYVLLSLDTCLHSKIKLGNLCPVRARSSRILALVAKLPFLVFFNFAIFKSL